MTTQVKIENLGPDVIEVITRIPDAIGKQWVNCRTMEPSETETFYVHEHQSLVIKERKHGE